MKISCVFACRVDVDSCLRVLSLETIRVNSGEIRMEIMCFVGGLCDYVERNPVPI